PATFFHGYITRAAVYSVVLTGAQALAHFNAGNTPPAVGMRRPLVEMYNQGKLKRQLAINLMQAKPPVAVGGTTFVQGLTATAVAVTAALTKQIGKLVTATSVGVTASLARQTNKAL